MPSNPPCPSAENAQKRQAGVLLHVTSLPGPFGIGDMGPQARAFVDWLMGAGLRLWQILPINPPGSGNSPYSTFSSFAGSPLLISPDQMVRDGLLDATDVRQGTSLLTSKIDYPAVGSCKQELFGAALRTFLRNGDREQQAAFGAFCDDPAQAVWLDDYCRFTAIKAAHHGAPWHEWPPGLRAHDAGALSRWESAHSEAVHFHRFVQFVFFSQWERLKHYAAGRGVRLIGDLPIYVSLDSADVWANQELFKLDREGRPTVVAGVPPDYFSKTGQLWGNPIYRWDVHERTGFAWWRERLRAAFRTVDVLRLDHFRGFAAYWEVPADHKTARKGRWVKGPGPAFFEAIADAVGDGQIIAEDLGLITPEVVSLREQFALPGMHVIQFAFTPATRGSEFPDPANPNLPFNHRENAVVYSGTHDNDTTRGWYENAPETERHIARTFLYVDGGLIHWDLVRAAFSSVARWAIVPVQDILGLGADARMNTPGVAEGNWAWRLEPNALTQQAQEAVLHIARFYGRCDLTHQETAERGTSAC